MSEQPEKAANGSSKSGGSFRILRRGGSGRGFGGFFGRKNDATAMAIGAAAAGGGASAGGAAADAGQFSLPFWR